MADKNLPCWRCIHKEVCGKKETYEAFLDTDAWEYHSDTGLLCNECAKAYQDMLDEFFDR